MAGPVGQEAAVAEAVIGILMLETRFPRPPGDVGNPLTWRFPVRLRVVAGARAETVVHTRAEALVPAFCAAARELVAEGARGIVANCGFLALHQEALAEAAGVPVLSSSLLQVALAERLLPPGQRAGVLTIAPGSLTPAHLAAAGARPDTPIEGVPAGGALAGPILGDGPHLDMAAAEAEMVAAAQRLAARPKVGALVFECTNMAPYAAAVQRATGLPVHTMVGLIEWFHAALAVPVWPRGGVSD